VSHVYRVGSLYATEYFNTSKEAFRFKPGLEEPESLVRLDAAAECNKLDRMLDETETRLARLRYMVGEFLEVCPSDVIANTEAGRQIQRYCIDNPVASATCADRGGQQSYGV